MAVVTPAEARPRSNPVIGLLIALTIAYAASFIGAQGSIRGLGDWYDSLQKPFFNPPSWVFSPVWTVLFGLMGVASWRVYQYGKRPKPALAVYGVQLVLNALWSWLFFAGRHLMGSAVEIVVLLAAVALTTLLFFPQDRLAGWLFVPYVLWVMFATALNWTIWALNR